VRHTHADCANCEDGLAADTIDVQHSRDWVSLVRYPLISVCMRLTSGKEHDNSDHARRKQRSGVSCQTELFKDGWCVVENGIDTCLQLERSHSERQAVCLA
jgi:hypothetical protein